MKKYFYLFGTFFIGAYLIFFYHPCISSGGGEKIQNALKFQGSKAILCQGAVFLLDKPIIFTQKNQQLFTLGLPKDSDKKALLKVVNKENSLAINAFNQDGATIKNIKVDGNRRELGFLKSHGLVLVGGNVNGQEVDSIEAFDSRSWTTVHVNWGDFYTDKNNEKHTGCRNVKITDNLIGPSGEETENKWSDGISLQCEKSLISNNIITDVTDGGIVIFGAPDSLIINNQIKAAKKQLLVGIALVDYQDYKGNYQNVLVSNNKITAENNFIRVGIAMGSRLWHVPGKNFSVLNRGAIIKNNLLEGNNFGYGYAVNGVENFTVINNIMKGISKVGSPFLMDKKYSQGTFQPEFQQAKLEKIYDIRP